MSNSNSLAFWLLQQDPTFLEQRDTQLKGRDIRQGKAFELPFMMNGGNLAAVHTHTEEGLA